MKNILVMLAIATTMVACTSGEEAVVEETTVDTNVVIEDTTTFVEDVEVDGELSTEVE